MPRIARGETAGGIYHIINRGNMRMQVFDDDEDYAYFLELLKTGLKKEDVKLHAYCLMPNHFHLLLVPRIENMAVGDYRFALTVTDNTGITNHDTLNIAYPYKPVADAGADQSISFGESVTLDGSGSYDSDGEIVNYQWRKWDTNYCSGDTPECVVEGPTAGSHTFELMVTDNYGAVDSDSVEIYVSSEASLISTYDTPGSALDVALSEDGNIAYIADGRYGLQIIDISAFAR